jgi:hypothetical protein
MVRQALPLERPETRTVEVGFSYNRWVSLGHFETGVQTKHMRAQAIKVEIDDHDDLNSRTL